MVVTLVLASALSLGAFNDAALIQGGAPKMMDAHPTIQMVKEAITININDINTNVDCMFTFKNDGPATKVKMGFPDRSYGAAMPDPTEQESGKMSPPSLKNFTSFVNGVRVQTRVEPGAQDYSNGYELWHVKEVEFPAKSTVEIRDFYSLSTRENAAISGKSGTYSAHQFGYVLNTGSSWKGNIGETTVTVNFNLSAASTPLHLVPVPKGDVFAWRNINPKYPKRIVIWKGPSKPTIKGRTLTFNRKNYRPTEKDDIFLAFGYSSLRYP